MPAAPGAGSATAVGSQPHRLTSFNGDDDDDDDFQNPCSLTSQSQFLKSIDPVSSRKPLRHRNGSSVDCAPKKRPRRCPSAPGKENSCSGLDSIDTINDFPDLVREENLKYECGNKRMYSEQGCNLNGNDSGGSLSMDLIVSGNDLPLTQINERKVSDSESDGAYLCNPIESRSSVRRLDTVNGTISTFKRNTTIFSDLSMGHHSEDELLCGCSLDLIKPSIECSNLIKDGDVEDKCEKSPGKKVLDLEGNGTYLVNSIESKLVAGGNIGCDDKGLTEDECSFEEFEGGVKFDLLLKLCMDGDFEDANMIYCPLCGLDISDLSEESRQVHTNECLDHEEEQTEVAPIQKSETLGNTWIENDGAVRLNLGQVVDVNPVLGWLCSLGLERYEEFFTREEIDWDSLQWLTEEDLCNMGISALGPRKKIMHAVKLLKKGDALEAEDNSIEPGKKICVEDKEKNCSSEPICADNSKSAANKLITDYFVGSLSEKKARKSLVLPENVKERRSSSGRYPKQRNEARKGKHSEVPLWCCIPGTPFRVDAFRYLRRECSHWFLTHFHMDHYQGLTRSFYHGKIYCSEITAKLVNLKIGISWDKLQILPLNEKINIAGIDVTCFDANHCPGSIIILFEPPNGEAILHTGDFRFSNEMAAILTTQAFTIHTLILDTTYCQAQYDFPKQDAVVQFVIEAIQAEAFNTKTLFLIGSYTIGKERLFMEVARVLRKKVYVGAAKLQILKCFGYAEEDMQWLTLNEQESHIHVVPMWMLASFKRLKHISNQYLGRFSLIVAFSPTGWTLGKGKKKGTGRRWQQGTLIRYEVPYSEHCSFSELREFVKFISPVKIIPSVNNDGPDSANAMISLLSS
ncbi:hypothetical protein SAY87_019177 [Trapa incisa]|uniref:SAM domain-containing protein n=1 Tax=Trapa incisa TaxID=236973 RepID=A0AAN7Q1L1_9MYRT|nr:hypothetical protein SAY87_019177 [Trapa incisa]